MKFCAAVGGAILGYYLPDVYVTNRIQNRQQSIMRAFPDALDLLLICVESGMSIESAFTKVAAEIGQSSVELAEELVFREGALQVAGIVLIGIFPNTVASLGCLFTGAELVGRGSGVGVSDVG